jgi:hypothetical protein
MIIDVLLIVVVGHCEPPCRRGNPGANIVFVVGVVFSFAVIVKRHPSFWIATSGQRRPRNDDTTTTNGKRKRHYLETTTPHRVCLRFAKPSSPARGDGNKKKQEKIL